MARRRKSIAGGVLDVSRESAPQCAYLSYGEGIGAARMNLPRHEHRDAAGKYLHMAWGTAEACTYKAQVVEGAVN